jgi:lactobin A/cerein 7B family class IIb bacteriocin
MNVQERNEVRELTTAELDVVSGGGWLSDLVTVVAAGAVGAGLSYLGGKANGYSAHWH